MHALAMGLQSLKMFNFSLGQSPVINVQMHNALARSVAAFTILSLELLFSFRLIVRQPARKPVQPMEQKFLYMYYKNFNESQHKSILDSL